MKAEDVVDLVASPEMQVIFAEKGISKPSISKRTAARWLQKLDWRYQKTRNGMYIDGHEREDVVAYRRAFVERWKTYDMRFHKWDNDGCELPRPNGFPLPDNGPFHLVLITHDESTFYQNDRRKIVWAESTSGDQCHSPKGDGQSIMVSDFHASEWGRLRDGDECVPHCLSPIFLLTFCFSGKLGLSSKLARTAMAISARKISTRAGRLRHRYFLRACPKVTSGLSFFLTMHQAIKNELWMRYRHGKCSKVGTLPFFLLYTSPLPPAHSTEEGLDTPHGWAAHAMRSAPRWRCQVLLLSPDDHPSMPGWFKGMEQISSRSAVYLTGRPRGSRRSVKISTAPLNGLTAAVGGSCFSQPDFVNQKSQLQELIEGHVDTSATFTQSTTVN